MGKEYPFMARAKTAGNGNPRGKQAEAQLAVKPLEINKITSPADLEAEIRLRAYERYKKRGYAPGHEHEDWLIAEQEVLAERGILARTQHA
jgi:hypothetical protein